MHSSWFTHTCCMSWPSHMISCTNLNSIMVRVPLMEDLHYISFSFQLLLPLSLILILSWSFVSNTFSMSYSFRATKQVTPPYTANAVRGLNCYTLLLLCRRCCSMRCCRRSCLNWNIDTKLVSRNCRQLCVIYCDAVPSSVHSVGRTEMLPV